MAMTRSLVNTLATELEAAHIIISDLTHLLKVNGVNNPFTLRVVPREDAIIAAKNALRREKE